MKTKIQIFFLYIIMQSFMKIELDVCSLLGFVCVCERERERERERDARVCYWVRKKIFC